MPVQLALSCRLRVMSGKTHVEHNESALTLIADFPGTWISVAMGHNRTHVEQQEGVYSITSSARASNAGGIATPRAFAAFILMTNSNLTDCTTGRSIGFAPLRICPA